MGPMQAAIAVDWLGVDYAVPIHYDTFPPIEQDPDDFRREVRATGSDAEVVVPGADEPFDLEHLPVSRVLLPHKGKVLETSASLEPSRITSFSVGLAGAGDLEPPGPFCLELAGVFAHESTRGPLSLDVLPHPPAALSASSASSVEQPARATRMRDR
jgi:hypothetical protein